MQGQIVAYEGERDPQGWPNGKGKATFESGFDYQGDWMSGLMHGVGTLTNPHNHEEHQGQFEFGMKHGKGRFK